MIIDTDILTSNLCADYEVCYFCPLWLGPDKMCAVELCEKEYKNLYLKGVVKNEF